MGAHCVNTYCAVVQTVQRTGETVFCFATAAESFGLKLNTHKMVLMATSYDDSARFDNQIEVNGWRLEIVDNWCYFGATIGSKAKIVDRISKASKAFFAYQHFWKQRAIDL
eukprot:Lankesteria_metandrocarpae@DN7413_c0_g1_i1.p1